MRSQEFSAFLHDMFSEATHVVDTVWVKDSPTGSTFVLGLKSGALFHVTVSQPDQEPSA